MRCIPSELKEKYAEAMDRDDVNAIVLAGAGGKFCGGFDINVFTEVHKTGKWSCHRLAASIPRHLPELPPPSLDTALTSADSICVCIVGRNVDNDD
uniref:Uncharacterized protein n=1 Tax=Oryza nivara TaxID=4536 RepID=A0A0E0IPY7_ORYNI